MKEHQTELVKHYETRLQTSKAEIVELKKSESIARHSQTDMEQKMEKLSSQKLEFEREVRSGAKRTEKELEEMR